MDRSAPRMDRSAPPTDRLVVLCAGPTSLHITNRWLEPGRRAFRLWLVLYDDAHDVPGTHDRADRVFRRAGSKWDLVRHVAPAVREADPDWVWLPDDDIAIDVEHVNAFFDLCDARAWDMLQPSLLPRHVSCAELVQRLGGPPVRPSGFVEIQMPCFSRRARDRCLELIDAASWCKSGWGFDVVWSAWPGVRKGVVDAVGAVHTKPVNTGSGFYAQLGIDPVAEKEKVLALHSNDRGRISGSAR